MPSRSNPAESVDADTLGHAVRDVIDRAAVHGRVLLRRDGQVIGAVIGLDDLRVLDAEAAGVVPERRYATAPTFRHTAVAQEVHASGASTKPVAEIATVLALHDAGVSPRGIADETRMQERTVRRIVSAAQTAKAWR